MKNQQHSTLGGPATTFDDIELGNLRNAASPASSVPPSDHVITTNAPYKFIFSVAQHEIKVDSVGRGGPHLTKHQTTVRSLTHRPWLTIPLFLYNGLAWVFLISSLVFACVIGDKVSSLSTWLGISAMLNLGLAVPMLWILAHLISRRTSGFAMWTYVEDSHIVESFASGLEAAIWYESRERTGDYVKKSASQLPFMYKRLARLSSTLQVCATLNSVGASLMIIALLVTGLSVTSLHDGASRD